MLKNKNIFKSKVILVTGGTSSFGNKIVEHLLKNYSFNVYKEFLKMVKQIKIHKD